VKFITGQVSLTMREAPYQRLRYRAILSSTGLILCITGVLTFIPLLAAFIGPVDSRTAGCLHRSRRGPRDRGHALWKRLDPGRTSLTLQEAESSWS